MKNTLTNTAEIKLEYPELRRLLLSHRPSILSRVREIANDALERLAKGDYDSNLFFIQILKEIEKSRDLFKGFKGKKSNKNLCEILEQNFKQKDIRFVSEKLEAKFLLLFSESSERRYLTIAGDIEFEADKIFSRLIRDLRELEQG